jgi:hypothetical protein
MPFFTASTPAISVVATAPKPGINIPSLPSAGVMLTFIVLVYCLNIGAITIIGFSTVVVFG